jgi:hypothetical protein
MGGLGPNKDTKWDEAANRLERMKKFSENIGRLNAKNMKLRKSPPRKEKSKRDKALEFAMSIKKPKLKPSEHRLMIEFENTRERNKYYDDEVDDQKLRLQKEKIRLIYQL